MSDLELVLIGMDGGDIRLFITLVTSFIIRFFSVGLRTLIGWFIKLSVQTIQPLIVTERVILYIIGDLQQFISQCLITLDPWQLTLVESNNRIMVIKNIALFSNDCTAYKNTRYMIVINVWYTYTVSISIQIIQVGELLLSREEGDIVL